MDQNDAFEQAVVAYEVAMAEVNRLVVCLRRVAVGISQWDFATSNGTNVTFPEIPGVEPIAKLDLTSATWPTARQIASAVERIKEADAAGRAAHSAIPADRKKLLPTPWPA